MMCLDTTARLLTGVLLALTAMSTLAAGPRSGYDYVKPATRAMQDDDFENPGLLAVERGQRLFNDKTATASRACAGCHGTDGTGLERAGIARYPVVDAADARTVTLQAQIERCRVEQAGAKPLPVNHPDRLALETFVRHRAAGEPVNVQTDGPAAALLKRGQQLYQTRYGLIDMACYQCHDLYTGQRIRGQTISQGQGNGFPSYRLGTGEITGLNQRIRQCMALLRAEPFNVDSEELRLLELYIMARSNGLTIETPAVRY